jgi:hypothetical protein
MKRSLRNALFVGVFSLSLPAWASVWFTNRTETTFVLELVCPAKSSEHVLEGNTTANYALPKGQKTCQLSVKDGSSGTLLYSTTIEDSGRYEVSEGGKVSKR